jgi:hypothetical protein
MFLVRDIRVDPLLEYKRPHKKYVPCETTMEEAAVPPETALAESKATGRAVPFSSTLVFVRQECPALQRTRTVLSRSN